MGKIFNRNTVKISYCTTCNLENFICQHNKNLLNADIQDNPPKGMVNCSCPANKKDICPLDGRCLDINIIYQAEVENKNDSTKETYVGLTSTTLRAGYQHIKNHLLTEHITKLLCQGTYGN